MLFKFRQKNRYIYLLLGVLAGFIIWGLLRFENDRAQKVTVASEIKEEMDSNEFKLAISTASQNGNDIVNSYVEWWYHDDENKYYFFLPGAWKKDSGLFWVFSNADSILFDGKIIHNGDECRVKEGEYAVEAGDIEYLVSIMYSSDIPTLFIDMESGTLDYIHESKDNRESADYVLFDGNGTLNNYGFIESFSCRGNASFTDTEKKSYRMKFKEKDYLLDLGEDKDWLLLANAFDKTLSKNMIVNTIAQKLNMSYVPDMEYVDVYANGEYLGNYLLSEKIEIDNERVNIRNLEKETQLLNSEVDLALSEVVIEDPDKLYSRKWHKIDNEPADYTGGYLMEIELIDRYGLEESGFITSRMQAVVVHSPKYASLNQIGYVADLYQDFENAVFSDDGLNQETGKYFYEYIDMESFTQKYMIEELSKNLDASYTSFFLYVPENDGRLYAGPIWDYDKALGINTITNEGIELSNPQGLYAAYEKKDSDILYALYQQNDFREYLNKFHKEQLKNTVEYMTSIYIDENARRIVDAALMEDVRWHKFDKGNTLQEKKGYFFSLNEELKIFLNERMNYLYEEWGKNNEQ